MHGVQTPSSSPDVTLNQRDTESLLARKDELVASLAPRLARLGLELDYSWNVMRAAGRATLPADEHILLLEELVELEAIKYTLAARVIRDLNPEE